MIDQAIQAGDAKLALNLLKHMQLGRAAAPGPADLTLAKDEIAILHEEELQLLHDRAEDAGNKPLSPRERERSEMFKREWEASRKEKAAGAEHIKSPA